MSQQKKYLTQLAGEYFVAGELFRQDFFAAVTFGVAKSLGSIPQSKLF